MDSLVCHLADLVADSIGKEEIQLTSNPLAFKVLRIQWLGRGLVAGPGRRAKYHQISNINI